MENTAAATESISETMKRKKRAPNGMNSRGKRIHRCDELTSKGGICDKLFTRGEHLRYHILSVHHRIGLGSTRNKNHMQESDDQRDCGKTITSANGSRKRRNYCSISKSISTFGEGRTATELELMRHYVHNAHVMYMDEKSFCWHKRDFWLNTVAQAIQQGSKMLNIALALSSAHLSMLLPQKDEFYSNLSIHYLVTALACQRNDVAKLQRHEVLSKDQLDALLLVAMMTPMLAFWTVEKDTRRAECSNDQLFEGILNWPISSQPWKTLLPQVRTASSFGQTVFNKYEQDKMQETSPLSLPQLDSWPIQYFKDIVTAAEEFGTDKATRDICTTVLKSIEIAFYAYTRPEFENAALHCRVSAGIASPPEFVALLQRKEPLALAVWARFLALEVQPAWPWWCKIGNVMRKLECLSSFLPADWLWTIDLPLQLVLGDTQISDVVYRKTSASLLEQTRWLPT